MKTREATILAVMRRHCWIGEEPLWWSEKGRLIQKDEDQALLVNIETGEYDALQLEQEGAAFGFTQSGRLFQASQQRVCMVDEAGRLTPLHEPVKLLANIFNDGKTGPDGRFYVGTIYGDGEDGGLYCLDSSGKLTLKHAGLKLSNGLDWSPDGRWLYLADSGTKEILRFAFDPQNGIVGEAETLMKIPDGIGGPDGMCMDTEGFLWCALWGKGNVARIDVQAAKIAELVHLPARAVASCAFVGENYDRLAVTTASYPNREPAGDEDGFTYIIDVGKRGLAPYRFPD